MISVPVKRLMAFSISAAIVLAAMLGEDWVQAWPYALLWSVIGFITINAPWRAFIGQIVGYLLLLATAMILQGRNDFIGDLVGYATILVLPGTVMGGFGRSIRWVLEDL